MTIQKDTQMESRNGWHKNTREKTRGEIESLVGKENLTAKELALYLYVDEKTIRNYIRRLCRSGNELKEADFKSNGKYIVKPEVQKIFIILVNANWDKSHKHKIRYKKQISEELIEKIENNLDAEDKKRIQSSEPYLNAKLEKNLIEKYFLAWHMLNEVIFQTDTKIRFRYIEKVIKTVSKMRGIITVNKKTTKRSIDRLKYMMPAYLIDENISDSLEKALISIMVSKLRKTEIDNEANTDEIIKKLTYNIKAFDEDDLRERNELVQELLFPLNRREQLKQKVDSIFDLTDDLENQIAQFIKDTFDDVYFSVVLKEKGDVKDIDMHGIKEDMYKNFFNIYMELSQYFEVVQSKEYKEYLKIKDTEEFKNLFSK